MQNIRKYETSDNSVQFRSKLNFGSVIFRLVVIHVRVGCAALPNVLI